MVAAFSQAHPNVTMEVCDLRADSIELLLLRGELDLGVAFQLTEHAEIETEPLFDERMLLVVGPLHPLAGRRSLILKALAGMPLALLPRSFATRRQPAADRRDADGQGRDGFCRSLDGRVSIRRSGEHRARTRRAAGYEPPRHYADRAADRSARGDYVASRRIA